MISVNQIFKPVGKYLIPDRFIEITSGNDQQWVTLEAVNSYDGKTIVENGALVTTKSEYIKTGSIFSCILAHSLYNALSFIAMISAK